MKKKLLALLLSLAMTAQMTVFAGADDEIIGEITDGAEPAVSAEEILIVEDNVDLGEAEPGEVPEETPAEETPADDELVYDVYEDEPADEEIPEEPVIDVIEEEAPVPEEGVIIEGSEIFVKVEGDTFLGEGETVYDSLRVRVDELTSVDLTGKTQDELDALDETANILLTDIDVAYDDLTQEQYDELVEAVSMVLLAIWDTDPVTFEETTSEATGKMVVNKYIEADSSNVGKFTLTLEAYATGENIVTQSVKPADIVLVMDQSASMWTPVKSSYSDLGFLATQMNSEKAKQVGYYVVHGCNSNSLDSGNWWLVHYDVNDSVKPWKFYRVQYKGKGGVVTTEHNYGIPGNMPVDGIAGFFPTEMSMDPNIIDLYEYSSLEAVMSANNGLDDHVYVTRYGAMYDAAMSFVNDTKNSGVEHRIAVVGFSGAHSNSETYFQKNTGNYLFDGSTHKKYDNVFAGTEDLINPTNYQSALKSVQTNYDDIVASINALCTNYWSTFTNIGLTMAKKIFEHSSGYSEAERSRIVVLLTDGEVSGGDIGKENTYSVANDIKTTYKSTLYTVGTGAVVAGSNAATFLQNVATSSDHALLASNTHELLNAFGTISNNLSGTNVSFDETSVLKDIITADFQLPEEVNSDDIEVYSVAYQGNDSFASEGIKLTDANVEISTDRKTITVVGFDYADNYVADAKDNLKAHGNKLVVKIPIEYSSTVTGGTGKYTNEASSGVYPTPNSPESDAVKFPRPTADVPVKVTVKKEVDNNEGDETVFPFTITYTKLTGYSSNNEKTALSATGTNEKIDQEFKDNSSYDISGIVPETMITITETISEGLEDIYNLTGIEVNYNNGTEPQVYTPTDGGYTVKVVDGMTITFINTLQKADIQITKTGADEDLDLNQSFIFTIEGTEGTVTAGVDMTVVVVGNGTVTIKDLLIGEYTVTEESGWSGRYTATPKTYTKTITADMSADSNQFTFANTRTTTEWLDGNAIATNKFGKKGD